MFQNPRQFYVDQQKQPSGKISLQQVNNYARKSSVLKLLTVTISPFPDNFECLGFPIWLKDTCLNVS